MLFMVIPYINIRYLFTTILLNLHFKVKFTRVFKEAHLVLEIKKIKSLT